MTATFIIAPGTTRRTLVALRALLAGLVAFVVLAFATIAAGQAGAFTVTNANDAGPGSLRRAITDAAITPGSDTVAFDAALDGATITLNSELRIRGAATADFSGQGNDATVHGTTPTTGPDGSLALRFNGTSDYLEIDHDLDPGNGELTLATWIYLDATTSTFSTIVARQSTADGSNYGKDSYAFVVAPDGRVYIGGTDSGMFSTAKLSTGRWYHVTGVISPAAKQIHIYDLDGTLIEFVENPSGSPIGLSDRPVTIGGGHNFNSNVVDQHLHGALDDLRFFSRALTVPEIEALHEGDGTANHPPVFQPRTHLAREGKLFELELRDQVLDRDGDTLTLAAVTDPLPPGASFDALSGVLSWVPEAGSAGTHLFAFTANDGVAATVSGEVTVVVKADVPAIAGPLFVNPDNPRYFADGTLNGDGTYRSLLMTGSHTWHVLQDGWTQNRWAWVDFDYEEFLCYLTGDPELCARAGLPHLADGAGFGATFVRFWIWENGLEGTGDAITGPEPQLFTALKPGEAGYDPDRAKYDLSALNPKYVGRLRDRIVLAGEVGIYVSVMLFQGWSMGQNQIGATLDGSAIGHPFNGGNNVNGIDGDFNHDDEIVEIHEWRGPPPDFSDPADPYYGVTDPVLRLQIDYVKAIVDAVGDLDNVLYEIGNEMHTESISFQCHMIEIIKHYGAEKAAADPAFSLPMVGMTAGPEVADSALMASPADWVSLKGEKLNPNAWAGAKVHLTDSDHFNWRLKDPTWPWRALTRGHNPILMDAWTGAAWPQIFDELRLLETPNADYKAARIAMGQTIAFARRMNLTAMIPRMEPDFCSTTFCLANASAENSEYLVYAPDGGEITLDLSATTRELSVEWFRPATGESVPGARVTGGGPFTGSAPFPGEAVLYIADKGPDTTPPVLEAAEAVNASTVVLRFDELLDPMSAESAANYSIDGGVTVTGASLGANGHTVTLTTSPMALDTTHTLSVQNVTDLAAPPNVGVAEITFTYIGALPGAIGHYNFNAGCGDLTIDASGGSTPGGVGLSGGGTSRVLRVDPGNAVTLRGLTLSDGHSAGSGGAHGGAILNCGILTLEDCLVENSTAAGGGGGIANLAGGVLALDRCRVAGNRAEGLSMGGGAIFNDDDSHALIIASTLFENEAVGGDGGAVYNAGGAAVSFMNSTVSMNTASGEGGGALTRAGVLDLTGSTFSANAATNCGGGLWIGSGGAVTLENAIVAQNAAPFDENITGAHGELGNNFTSGDPMLAPLGDHGGPTPTMPPAPGSPVIETGAETANTPATDQIGNPRMSGAVPDLGAVEAFSFSTLPLVDTDLDAMDDRLEALYGFTVGALDGHLDSDRDGSSNAEELGNMTDPRNGADVFQILSFGYGPGWDSETNNRIFEVTWKSFPGLVYSLECDTSLSFPPEIVLGPVEASGFTETAIIVLPPGNAADFIRIRRE